MWWFAPGTVCLIAWGVLAFGGEYPWAYAPLLVFASTVGVLGLVAPVAGKGVSRSVVLALALIAAAIGLQLVPLGESVLAVVSPARVEQDYRALLAAAVPVLPGPEEAASGGTAADFGAAGADAPRAVVLPRTLVFFLGCFRALSAVRASGAVRGLMALGVVVALVAIVQETSRSPLVYGVWWPRKVESLPAAPFINENHLAGWLVMAYSMALGYLCGGLALGRVDASVGWRRRVIWLGSRDGSEVLLAGLAVLLMALAVVVTLSVSGLACLLLVCLVFGWWTTRGTGRTGWRVLCLAGLVSVPLAAIGWLGIDVVGGELAMASWSDVGGRVGIWRDTLRMIGDFPISGTGFNTFGVAMLAYQTYRTDVHVVEAHNDYLQLTAEGGALVGLPILFGIVVFARQVRRRFREANDDMRIYWLRIGAVTGLAALAFQSVVDFSLQMPGNAVTFALLMAGRGAPSAAPVDAPSAGRRVRRIPCASPSTSMGFSPTSTAPTERSRSGCYRERDPRSWGCPNRDPRKPTGAGARPAGSNAGCGARFDPARTSGGPSIPLSRTSSAASTTRAFGTVGRRFVTQRPPTAGESVQRQSQLWLAGQGFSLPSVIVHGSSRGRLAGALGLDFLVDDTIENCVDAVEQSDARPILVCRREDAVAETNAKRLGIAVCRNAGEALDVIGRAAATARPPLIGRGAKRLRSRER